MQLILNILDRFVPSSFLDVTSLSAVLPRPYKINLSREIPKTESSCALLSFIRASFDILLTDADSFEKLHELNTALVTNWKFSHVTTFDENFNRTWSFDTVENLLSACLDSKLKKYACDTENSVNHQRSTLLLNTISLLRFVELWSFLKHNYYQHLEQYQYYRFQLGNVDSNVINEIKMIFPLLERRCIDLQIYIRESAIRIAYILNLQLFILNSGRVKRQTGQPLQSIAHPYTHEFKCFLPFQNLNSKQTSQFMIDDMWLGSYEGYCEPSSENVRTLISMNASYIDRKFELTNSSIANVYQHYKRVSKKIYAKYSKNTNNFQCALFLNNFITNDLFLKILKKEKVDMNIFINNILPKGVDFARKNKCGGATIFCWMMDSDMITEQNEKEKCLYNRFLVSFFMFYSLFLNKAIRTKVNPTKLKA